jgi:hypothetical protein
VDLQAQQDLWDEQVLKELKDLLDHRARMVFVLPVIMLNTILATDHREDNFNYET